LKAGLRDLSLHRSREMTDSFLKRGVEIKSNQNIND